MKVETPTWTCHHCPFAPRDALRTPQRAQTLPVLLLPPAAVLLHLDGAWHIHMCIWCPQALDDLIAPCDAAVGAYGLQIWLKHIDHDDTCQSVLFQQGWCVFTEQLLSAMASMLCAVNGDAICHTSVWTEI